MTSSTANGVPVVPAAPGMVAFIVGFANQGSRPCLEDVQVRQVQVIAWRIRRVTPQPVLMDGTDPEEEIVLLPLPDGGYERESVGAYPSLEQAKKEILEEEQREWDRRHQGETT